MHRDQAMTEIQNHLVMMEMDILFFKNALDKFSCVHFYNSREEGRDLVSSCWSFSPGLVFTW